MGGAVEAAIRERAAEVWVSGGKKVLGFLAKENAGFAD